MVGRITTMDRGVGLVVEWRIENFSTLSRSGGTYYCSPFFSFDGEKWCLYVYPNGSSAQNSYGHVDLCLYNCLFGRYIRLSFSLSLKTAKGKKYNEEYYTKDFDNDNWKHTISRFIARSELNRRRHSLMPDNALTIVCTLARTTSADDAASSSAECRYCKGTVNADNLSSHQKKCMHRPTKCPDCLEVIILEKWLKEHECQLERPEGEACAPVPSTSHHEKKVLHDFKELLLKKKDCDVIIKVKGSEFSAHKFVLKTRSPVFASTFRHDMKESSTNIVEIEDCDPSSFLDFLCFLYCGDVGMISMENVFSLFTTADKYEVLDLKMECLKFMKKNITINTFCETITLALQHSETELISLATVFFLKNAKEILLTVKWQTFVAENPTQSNELFIKFVRLVNH